MIENLGKLLLKKYNYKLGVHKVCNEEIKKSQIIVPAIAIFVIMLILYIFQVISIIVLGFAFFVFVLIPLALKKGEKYNVLIVTPDRLIQQTTKKDVVVIEYEDVKKFSNDDKKIIIKDAKGTIVLDPESLADDILSIVEVLEAKGKTFDKTKDYMIRPIEVKILKNKIIVKDIEQAETSTEKIVAEVYKDYAMLTPGFIKDIILMNAVVDDSYTENNNLFLNLSRFEVNPGHPENTMFESQMANDCIMIFEDVEIINVSKRKARGTKEEEIDTTVEGLIGIIEKGVISDWKYLKNKIELQFSVGIFIVRTSFKYKEVIIGWNEFN